MMWGCMSWDGPGYASKIDTTMDAALYVSILEDELQMSLEYWDKTAEDIIFQQDNDPKHISKKTKEWFQNHDIVPMVWPPQSPDLNPIEHLWQHLKMKLAAYSKPLSSMKELWKRTEKEWKQIDAGYCQKLISSMPERVAEVLKAKGGHTRY